jgi:hypothetical protein
MHNADSPWGWQVDGDLSYVDFDWISANVDDGFAASTKLIYSFWGPADGSTGKLFRSAAVGLTPN